MIEPRVTESLRAIESDVPGATMVGLEFRLKGDERLKYKIAKENRDNPARDLRDISEGIPDAIRYTYQFDAAHYTRGYHDVCARLEGEGYTLVHSVNSWDSPDYKGINTRWRTPDGPLFEVQFHTPESFAAKQETHAMYEKVRSLARRREDDEGGVHYEALGKELTWHFSDVIPAWKRLEATEDLEEISEAEANELIERFREEWKNL